ncbi:MAG: hypothetical protein MUC42_01610 [Bryobacter sp.]|jgi:hypothetical protein|nr:hypothetical protein [Bryobacter sp.]
MLSRRYLFLALPLLAQEKKKQPKPPDLEVMEISARREGDLIRLDGRVHNCGLRPHKGLVIIFEFLGANKTPMVTKKGPIETELLEVGEESEFRLDMPDPGKLIEFTVGAEDASGRELRLRAVGPHRIE